MAQPCYTSEIDAAACSTSCIHPEAVRPLLGRSLGAGGARAVADLFATLADPSRARVLHLLAVSGRELCVRDIALVTGMTVSALSHQLHLLRERHAVERRKVGRVAYYRLVDSHIEELVLGAAEHAAEAHA